MSPPGPTLSSLARRIVCLVYELFLLAAIVFFSMALFQAAAARPGEAFVIAGLLRYLFWFFLFLMVGLYFSWCWRRGGQTLPMRTWKIRLQSESGLPVSAKQVTVRYCMAWLSVLCAGLGFLWAVFDRDGQFFHDRIAGTRIVDVVAGAQQDRHEQPAS